MDLQTVIVAILSKREQVKTTFAKPADISPAAPTNFGNPVHASLQQLNPLAFYRGELFPGYPWDWDLQQHETTKYFTGTVPDNWRRYANSAEWTYSLDLFPAMLWYFRQLSWPEQNTDNAVSWAELSILVWAWSKETSW